MLPVTYFERLSAAWQLRTYDGARERRGGTRIDLRVVAGLCLLSGDAVSDVSTGRVREISRAGGSMVTQRKLRVGQELIMKVTARSDGAEYAIWCKVRRCNSIDDLFIVGFTFQKILYPGQTLKTGARPSHLNWVDVDGDRQPADPYEGENRAA